MALEVSQVRKLVQNRLAEVKRAAAARRERATAAERDYAVFLPSVAVPVVTLVSQILTAEGYPYRVTTPGGGVRMTSDRSARTYLDVRLDTSGAEPVVTCEISRERGHRVLVDDHPFAPGKAIASLTDADLVEFLLDLVADLVER
jgi:hypothetical protein